MSDSDHQHLEDQSHSPGQVPEPAAAAMDTPEHDGQNADNNYNDNNNSPSSDLRPSAAAEQQEEREEEREEQQEEQNLLENPAASPSSPPAGGGGGGARHNSSISFVAGNPEEGGVEDPFSVPAMSPVALRRRASASSPGMASNNMSELSPEQRAEAERFQRNMSRRKFLRCGKTLIMNKHEDSLYIFPGDSEVRNFLFDLYDNWWYELVVVCLVIFSVILVIVDSPNISSGGPPIDAQIVFICDLVVQSLYTLELLGKIVALGLIMHPHALLRVPGDFVDVAVVVAGWAALALQVTDAHGPAADGLRNFKVVRLYRVIKLLMHFPVVRAIFMTLTSAARGLRDIIALLVFVVFGMSVLGLQLFRGSFDNRCYVKIDDTHASGKTLLILDPRHPFGCTPTTSNLGAYVCPSGESECLRDASQFHVPYVNFDNIANSIFTVLKIIAVDNWHLDVRRIQFNVGMWYGIFAVVIVVLGSFFMMNLVLGVLSSQYELAFKLLQEEEEEDERERQQEAEEEAAAAARKYELKDKNEKNEKNENEGSGAGVGVVAVAGGKENDSALTTEEAQHREAGDEDDRAHREGDDEEEEEIPCCPPSVDCALNIRKWFDENIMSSTIVTVLSIVVTIINIAALAAAYHGMSETYSFTLDLINFFCGCFFVVEVTLFILARGLTFFTDAIQVLDFFLAAMAIVEFILFGVAATGSVFAGLRGLRMLRVLRLGGKITRLRKLFATVGLAAQRASALAAMLLVYVFLFALFATFFFSEAMPDGYRPNFEHLGNAVVALFIMLTGENFTATTIEAMSGSTGVAGLFLFVFFWIGNYVLLNFFIVILISAFSEAAELELELREQDERDALEQQLLEMQQQRDVEEEGDALEHQQRQIEAGNNVNNSHSNNSQHRNHNEENAEHENDHGEGRHQQQQEPQVHVESVGEDEDNRIEMLDGDASRIVTAIDSGLADALSAHDDDDDADPVPMLSVTIHDENGRSGEQDLLDIHSNKSGSSGGNDDDVHGPVDVNQSSMTIRQMYDKTWLESLAEFLGLEDYETAADKLPADNDSFFLIAHDNGFRRAVCSLVVHPVFELCVLIVVVEACIAIGFDNDLARKQSPVVDVFMFWNNVVVCVIFVIEAILKSIAFGFALHEDSYLRRNLYNVFDFAVVIVSITSIFLPTSSLMALRAFRVAAKWKAMRVVLESLAKAVPGILDVAFLLVLCMFMFAVMGVHLLMGSFVSCTDASVTLRSECNSTFNDTSWNMTFPNNGSEYNSSVATDDRVWTHEFFNFNDVANGMLSMMIIVFGDGWSTLFYNAMDATSYDVAMQPGLRYDSLIFFVLAVVIGNFFVNNLFVGSLMNSFKLEQDYANGLTDHHGRALLTEEQQDWVRSYKFVAATALPQRPPYAENCFRGFFCWLYFDSEEMVRPRMALEYFFSLCIIITVAFMASEHEGQSAEWTDVLFYVDVVMNAFFAVEVVVAFIALRPLCFVADSWNVFNVILVVAAYISLFFNGPGLNAIRVARVARLLRLIPRAKGLHRMYNTLVYSLPELANVSALMILVIYMFGVVGTQILQRVHYDASDDQTIFTEMFNFEHAGVSMVVLFQMATTSGWGDVLREAFRPVPETHGCSYEADTCGKSLAIPYFVLFMIVANSIFLNLFIFIIVDQYLEVKQLQQVRIEWLLAQLRAFRENWAQLDLDRTKTLRVEQAGLCYRLLLVQENEALKNFRSQLEVPVVVLRGPTREVLVKEVLAFHAIPTASELELEMKLFYLQQQQQNEKSQQQGGEEGDDDADDAEEGGGDNSRSSLGGMTLQEALEGHLGETTVEDAQGNFVNGELSRVFMPEDIVMGDYQSSIGGIKAEQPEDDDAEDGRQRGDVGSPTSTRRSQKGGGNITTVEIDNSGGRKMAVHSKFNDDYFMRRTKALHIPVHAGGIVQYEDCVFALTRFHVGCGRISDAAYSLLQRVRRFSDDDDELQLHQALAARTLLHHMRRFRDMRRQNRELQARLEAWRAARAGRDLDVKDSLGVRRLSRQNSMNGSYNNISGVFSGSGAAGGGATAGRGGGGSSRGGSRRGSRRGSAVLMLQPSSSLSAAAAAMNPQDAAEIAARAAEALGENEAAATGCNEIQNNNEDANENETQNDIAEIQPTLEQDGTHMSDVFTPPASPVRGGQQTQHDEQPAAEQQQQQEAAETAPLPGQVVEEQQQIEENE